MFKLPTIIISEIGGLEYLAHNINHSSILIPKYDGIIFIIVYLSYY